MPADLLFEIGTEEIPAGFVIAGLEELRARVARGLDEARLDAGVARALGTPRRLAVHVSGVADRQRDLSERVVGPPARVAFDADGKPTKAAEGFAKKNGVDVGDLERGAVEGKKGEYVLCTRHEPGRAANEVVAELLSAVIRELPWPKSMRWGWRDQAFARPVHWIVALLGEEVVPVELAGVRSGRASRGHRFLAPDAIEVTPASYAEALRAAFVIADPERREAMVEAELARLQSETGSRVRPDPELVREVTFLVEYPVGVAGEFDAAFLEVPEEVIVSAMRSHQRYFAMEDAGGALVNRFCTIAGTVTRDLDVVRRGNERVLAARLADARFFFREDQKKTLEEHAAALDDVVFQKKLGTIGAKVRRIDALAAHVAGALGIDTAAVARAAALCKADLVTSMVYEFPELQGIVGGHYARLAGEPDEVARAIPEHYQPRGASDPVPESDVGACVGLADRVDTLVGCFAAGLAPTGSADPYGLRRAALTSLAILLGKGWHVPLDQLVGWATTALGDTVAVTGEVRGEILAFLRTRLKGVLTERDVAPDCAEAALAARFHDVPDVVARAEAVATLRQRPDFEPLATAFKRVANILKGEEAGGEPDPARFTDDAERALWDAFTEIEQRASASIGAGDYREGLRILAELKTPVDQFFDAVLVMDENAAVRANRLALLGRINATFTRIADFRQLAV